MTLPNHLRTLLPNALDVLRYYHTAGVMTASIDDICQGVGLTERGFGKAIRSLVTRGYVVMDGNQIYRLTENGGEAAAEVASYDADSDDTDMVSEAESASVERRLVLVLPEKLVAGQPTNITVGFEAQPEQSSESDIVTRLTVVNGEPATPEEGSLILDSSAATQSFVVTAGRYTQARIKLEIYQLGPNPDDIAVAGGMYADIDVVAGGEGGGLVAYGADITINDMD